MSTTLPLFWHLSSASKKERLDASAKLLAALEHFQSSFVPKPTSPETSEDDEDDEDKATGKADGLDALNAQDVSYSIRRLIRGLASPRESSRLGFAVALTELLARLDTVTCSQIVQLVLDSSKTQARRPLCSPFGLTSVIQSGLLLRDATLPSSSTSASDLASFENVIAQLIALGEKKSWLRESAWWSISLAVDALTASGVSWKDDAVEATLSAVYAEPKVWTPEKLALTLKLQAACPTRAWKKLLAPTFKSPEILSTGNLAAVARVLKEADADEDVEKDLPKSGSWKPQVHFVWDALLDHVLPRGGDRARPGKSTFPEFFRIVVDESLFASTSSPERKYWGFQVFQKALPRVSAGDMPMLFTKNFMRSWINHLSNSERFLHKAARQVAADVLNVVKGNPTLGFSLILQLTGLHGSRNFDKLTKTKTVETILTSMDEDGIKAYIDYLLKQVNEEQTAPGSASADVDADADDIQALNTRRAWIVDQLSALVRNAAVPKADGWMQTILDWLIVHGLFIVAKIPNKSAIAAVTAHGSHTAFSDDLRRACRERLLACLAELTSQATVIKDDEGKASKVPAVAADGRLWVSRALQTIWTLEKDTKHVRPLDEADEDEAALRQKAREVIARVQDVHDDRREAARGVELLLAATLLHAYCADEDDADPDALESCIDGASRMFPDAPATSKKPKKGRTPAQDGAEDDGEPAPVDVLTDAVIGFLEKGTAYLRAAANQAFALLSGSATASTIDLVLAQLERRDPAELMADEEDEDVEMEGAGEDDEDAEDAEEDEDSSDSNGEDEEEEEDEDEEADLELRKKIEEALRVNGIAAATGDSDEEESEEELMDDEQMLALDVQLAAAFKARAAEKRDGKDVDAQREATHFKARVLDLVDLFARKHAASPLAVRLVLPLVALVSSTGPDERQLADKAAGILRTRLAKAKDVPALATPEDAAEAAKALDALHALARKAPSADALATLAACSLFLSKALLHAGDAGRAQASRLNTAFFDELVKRLPAAAWGLRADLVQAVGGALNAYRQAQCFHVLQTLVNQIQAVTEAVPFMATLSAALLDALNGACADAESAVQPAHAKDALKLALVAARQTKRVAADAEAVAGAWPPAKWAALGSALAASERFKGVTSLPAMCKQVVQIVQAQQEAKKSKGKNAKEGAVKETEGTGPRRERRKRRSARWTRWRRTRAGRRRSAKKCVKRSPGSVLEIRSV
ncbi:DNA polymerase phi-domain-containing protein [Epithele typhae]|uniref:DNA polymerase phi-domain-containing protein n=1 Tax=Epithele typhae TaxID=378194 RepID=UPI00200777D1|nr:DNA polymerase phi-domain-containing protein [Epithele typhae]KAH9923929.1 DNA polymerase phi-domain-containing protein [Epithele typhae]